MLKDTDEEIWRDIDGLENQYAISTKGRVRNIRTGRILAGTYNNDGYKYVILKGKGHTVHRLMALTFLDNPNNLPQVNHIDEDKRNNDISNLEWCSKSDNVSHSIHNQYCKIKQLDKDGNLIRIWDSIKQIECELGYFMSNIVNACKGKRRSAYNFQWQYLDPSSQKVVNRPIIAFKDSERIGEFASIKKASEALGLKYCSVYNCLSGRRPSNKGYSFKYAE